MFFIQKLINTLRAGLRIYCT